MSSPVATPPAQAPVQREHSPAEVKRIPWRAGAIVAVATLAIGLLVPYVITNPYNMGLILEAAILAMLALSIGFLARHLGLVSLGHTAFYGGSGYLVAIATTHWGWTPMQAAFLAVAAGGCMALVMGALVVRATGMGFLMLTLALGQACYQLAVQTAARPITGAHDGLLVTFDIDQSFFGLSGREVMHPASFWSIVWPVLVTSVFVLWLVGRSRFGTVLEGIRENEERMRFSGYNTFVPRLTAFVLSGLVASTGGVLIALHGSFVSPSMLSFLKSGDALIAAMVGGVGLLFGPVLGAALYVWAQANFNSSGNLHLYTGAALVIVIMFFPGGVAGGIRSLVARINSRRGGRA